MMQGLQRLGRAAANLPVVGVLCLAVRNYVLHQSANQAGSLAFSAVLAMFPLLLLLAGAAYIGQPGDAAALAERVLGYAPQLVRDVMQPVVRQVLAQRNEALLTVGLAITLWTGSSGMQAVRSALNRSYGIERGMPFWKARLKSTLFTVLVGSGVLLVFSSVIVMPRVWHLLVSNVAVDGQQVIWLYDSVRYGAAYLTLVVLYALLYGWLPDIPQRVYTVLPGALVGAGLWVVAAATLSYTLRSAGKLALIYGSFAGVVATLVFLYVSATTLIYGAEVNAVLRERQA